MTTLVETKTSASDENEKVKVNETPEKTDLIDELICEKVIFFFKFYLCIYYAISIFLMYFLNDSKKCSLFWFFIVYLLLTVFYF